MKIQYTLGDIKKKTLKPADAWWTVLIIDPIAIRLVWIFANFTKIKPNQITLFSFFIGLISAWLFLQGEHFYLILGAVVFEISFVFDCIDGKLSKLTNRQSKLGYFLDYALDRWRIFVNLFALIYGQYVLTGNNIFLIFGFIYMSLLAISLTQSFLVNKLCEDNVEKNDIESLDQNKSMFIKLKHILNQKRLLFGISDIETDTFVFFIFPLLGFVEIGFIVSISLLFIWLLISIIRFIYKFSNKNNFIM
jgi:phosphatidylglycerophosphate synthase